MRDMKLNIPAGAEEVLSVLGSAGFEAWVVGGCVRDALLGRKAHDWDICTAARPEEVIRLFSPAYHVIETGLKHGTVTAMMPDGGYEITTFRVDGQYSDHRHPDRVSFTPSLMEDLARRDFTMNAIAYHPERGLFDPFRGKDDLEKGLIRCVGDPEKRFQEDGLRIMRAIRFASVYRFRLEPETEKAVCSLRTLLNNISEERLQTELCKLLTGEGAEEILLQYREVIAEFIPELRPCFDFPQNSPWHCYDVYRHIAVSVGKAIKDPIVRLTMLLHDIAKPLCVTRTDGVDHFHGHPRQSAEIADRILGRLKFDNVTRRAVTELIENHDLTLTPSEAGVRREMSRLGEKQFFRLLDVKTADMLAQSRMAMERKDGELRSIRALAEQVLAEKPALTLKELAIHGDDLIAQGMKPTPQMGKLLQELLDSVIETPALNERETLLAMARERGYLP